MKGYTLKDCLRRQNGMSRYALNLEHRLRWYDTELAKAQKRIWELKDLLDYEKSISDQKQNEINLKYREVIALQEHVEELEKENADLKMGLKWDADNRDELLKENAELKKVAEFQQSSNMSRHFENKKLKEVLAVGSTFNKALNSMNKSLEEERDKYRNMVFDKDEQLTKAKEIIKELLNLPFASDEEVFANVSEILGRAEQFLKEAKK